MRQQTIDMLKTLTLGELYEERRAARRAGLHELARVADHIISERCREFWPQEAA